LAIGVAVWTFIGTVILRGAVALYNTLAGGPASPRGVPEPGFGKAMGITLAASVVMAVADYGIGRATGAGAAVAGFDWSGANLAGQVASIAAGLAVLAALLTTLSPTTFGRAVLVTVCYVLIAVLVGVIFAGIGFLMMMRA
jgi:hypothetical protein